MVFFTCNACGQAVKKNQVEKHYLTKCRNCTVLSCIDCGKEFVGEEYQAHVKCITEDEKYGGKGFQPKPSSGKGEAKQANWIANIKKYVAETNVPRNLANLLDTLMNYSNVPRKKQKFQNFLLNSAHIRDNRLADQAWEIFTKANQQDDTPRVDNNKEESPEKSEVKANDHKSDETTSTQTDADTANVKKHKKKRKKEKEEGDNLQNGNETDLAQVEEKAGIKESCETEESTERKSKKEKKRKKHMETINDSLPQGSSSNADSEGKPKKRRKHHTDEDNVTEEKMKECDEEAQSANHADDNEPHDPDINEINRKKKKKKRDKSKDTNEDLQDQVGAHEDGSKVKKKKLAEPDSNGNLLDQNTIENGFMLGVDSSDTNIVHKKKKKKSKHGSS